MTGAPTPTLILLGLLAAALLTAAATDLRERIIWDRLNLAIALCAPAFWWATGLSPWPGMALQLGLGVAVFAMFAGLFAVGMMGGGDVKLLGALALWLPLGPLVEMLFWMAVGGGALTIVMIVWHRIRPAEGAIEVPYGVAIAGAGLWVLGTRYLNQFV